MHKLLADLLEKRKLTIGRLSEEEKTQFDQWNRILSEEVTVEKIVEFLNIQKSNIEAQWANLDNKKLRNERLIMMHAVYGKILKMIEGTKAERQSVEEELNRLLTQ